MDGAIILAADGSRVARANVHLVPDPDIPTSETGTRHRTAERVARQISVPVITISEEMSVVSVHYRGYKKTLEPIPRVLARGDQALQILGRYKARLDGVSGALSALEVEDLVTVRDVATVLQRAEMVRRIAEEIEGYVVELGVDGRLVELQLEELTGGVAPIGGSCARTTSSSRRSGCSSRSRTGSPSSPTRSCSTCATSPASCDLPADMDLDSSLQPRGYRLLSKIPRLPEAIAENVVQRFGQLPEDHARVDLGSRRGRRRRRSTRPRDQGRPVPRRRDLHPRPLRVTVDAGSVDLAPMAALKEGPIYDVTVESGRSSSTAPTCRSCTRGPTACRVAGVVLHPDIGGLRPLFEDMARRLATHGLAVCAVEPFAHVDPADARRRIEARMAAVSTLDDERQLADLDAAADLLVVEDDVRRVSVLGFCMGGYYTFKAAASDRFDAAVAFYGMLRTPEDWRGAGHHERSARRRRRRCARRSRSSARPTRTRRPTTSTRCATRGRVATTARSSSSKAPTTASCTIPTARCTAPTTPRRCWQRALDWMRG